MPIMLAEADFVEKLYMSGSPHQPADPAIAERVSALKEQGPYALDRVLQSAMS